MGATFIKLGQVMSTRPDLFEPSFTEALRELQDKLPPFAFRHVRRIVEQDLGGKLEDHFREFSPAPLAAASVAQVHRARLHDGTEVAVKVLRPDIQEQVTSDGALLVAAARLLSVHPRARVAGLRGHVADFVEAIVRQTDLTLEATNYARFSANFKGFDGVFFPTVFPQGSTSRLLTMQLVEGTKVDEIRAGQHPEVDVRLTRMAFKMLFEDGFVHADLHPGNVLVTQSGELAILDVGLVKSFDGEELEFFIDFARCLTMGSGADIVRHLQRYYRSAGTVDWRSLEREAAALVGRFRGKRFGDIEVRDILRDLFAFARKHGVRPPASKVMVMVAIVTVEGIRRRLNPDRDPFQAMGAFLRPILQRRGMFPLAPLLATRTPPRTQARPDPTSSAAPAGT